MRIEYDRQTCTGMFQCIHEWSAFEKDLDAGKVVLDAAEEIEPGLFARTVPDDAEFEATMAARVCPVEAITVYDEDGEQLAP